MIGALYWRGSIDKVYKVMIKKTKAALISLFNIDFGLRYISAYLNYHGYHADIISLGLLKTREEFIYNNYLTPRFFRRTAYSDKDVKLLINLLLRLKPSFLGISVTSTSYIIAVALTKKIKEIFDIPIIWGGIHPTLCPDDCIEHADIVCIGEGEYPMFELAQKLENNERVSAINNFWIKHKDGSIEKNILRDLIINLDSLPYPDFVGLDNKFLIDNGEVIINPILLSGYNKDTYPIMSSRGCYNSCSFCCNSILKVIYKDKGPYLRRRTPENVINELVYVRESREVARVRFWDDIFTYDQQWIEEFCRLYIKNVFLPFSCYAHPEYTNEKNIRMLADAGLAVMDIGIQSGSVIFCRERYKRKQSIEELINCANLLKKTGIVPRYNFIMDNPYEDDCDLDVTAELLLKLPSPYRVVLYSLCYFPKTELTNQAVKDKFITEQEIEGKNNKALNNFYMFIDLAKNKKSIYWDTIISMIVYNSLPVRLIVDKLFQPRLIRMCKRNNFFRHYPKLLLILVRLSIKISLISPITVLKHVVEIIKSPKNTGRLLFSFTFLYIRSVPRFFILLAKVFIKVCLFFNIKGTIFVLYNLLVNSLRVCITETNRRVDSYNTYIEVLVKEKKNSSAGNKTYYLKIMQKECPKSESLFKLLIMLAKINSNFWNSKIWEINLTGSDIDADIEIIIRSNQLFYKIRGNYCEASIRKEARITKEEPDILYFLLYDELQKVYIVKNTIIINNDSNLILDRVDK